MICPKCLIDKELSAKYWHRNSSRRNGYARICKECKKPYDLRYINSEEGKERIANYKDKAQTNRRKYRILNREKEKESKKQYRKTERGRELEAGYKKKFRIKAKERMTDYYIKHLLRKECVYDPSPEIIEIRRNLLILNKTISEVKNEFNC